MFRFHFDCHTLLCGTVTWTGFSWIEMLRVSGGRNLLSVALQMCQQSKEKQSDVLVLRWRCLCVTWQVSLQSVESELQQVRDTSSHQKKRVVDMMTNLMKDLADIGSSIGSEFKVCCMSLKVVVYLYSRKLITNENSCCTSKYYCIDYQK